MSGPSRRGMGAWSGIVARGVAMGTAEVVPGVSGGTIAFVTGIYDELVGTLARFGPASATMLLQQGIVAFWRAHNLGFLAALGIGMVVGVLTFARVMAFGLEKYPGVVWGLFFGVIASSVWVIGRSLPRMPLLVYGLLGLLAAALLGLAQPAQTTPTPLVFFLAGVIAVSAWLLPAVSGSFMLLLMGLYEPMLRAINGFDLVTLASLGAGCLAGIALFARLLDWTLRHYRVPLLAFLTGFLAGSIVRLWPWRVGEHNLLPSQYLDVTGSDPMVAWVLVAIGAGGAAVWWVARARP